MPGRVKGWRVEGWTWVQGLRGLLPSLEDSSPGRSGEQDDSGRVSKWLRLVLGNGKHELRSLRLPSDIFLICITKWLEFRTLNFFFDFNSFSLNLACWNYSLSRSLSPFSSLSISVPLPLSLSLLLSLFSSLSHIVFKLLGSLVHSFQPGIKKAREPDSWRRRARFLAVGDRAQQRTRTIDTHRNIPES